MNYKGQSVDTTHSGGLNIREYWAMLFARNEDFFRRGMLNRVLTDEQLRQEMEKAFPGRKTRDWQYVGWHRKRYNNGTPRPRVQSRRYVRPRGLKSRLVYPATSRGVPIVRHNYRRLKKEAAAATRIRGHQLGYFTPVEHERKAIACCRWCGATVTINADPPSIKGRAVQKNCTDVGR